MKKRIISLLLIAVMLVGMMPAIGITASAATQSSEEGYHFYDDDRYETEAPLSAEPLTFEAEIKLSSAYKGSGWSYGSIIGNYKSGTTADNGLNFDLAWNKSYGLFPRIMYGANSRISFSQIDIRKYAKTDYARLIITLDKENGEAACYVYVGGELKQSQILTGLTIGNLVTNKSYFIGGGHYQKGAAYTGFDGYIKNVSVYSDVRTADEIASDGKGFSADRNDQELIVAYDFTSSTPLKDISSYGNDIVNMTDYQYSFVASAGSFDKRYRMDKEFTALPNTFAAETYFPQGVTEGGVIFSNYKNDENEFITFEVTNDGAPALKFSTADGNVANIVFDQVNLFGGGNYVVITHTGAVARCYVNGELKQTVEGDFVYHEHTFTEPDYNGRQGRLDYNEQYFFLGGDSSTDNTNYFKGKLKSVSLYSEALTPEEVAMITLKGAGANLDSVISYYDLSDYWEGYIADVSGNEYHVSHFTYARREEKSGYAYSFAVIGDTQRQTKYDYESITEESGIRVTHTSRYYTWLVNNKETKNIQYVFGLGDITEYDNDIEWEIAKSQIVRLDEAGIPYSVIMGNHDSIEKLNANFAPAGDDFYTKRVTGYYEAGNLANYYMNFEVASTKYMMIGLEYAPCDAVLKWANGVVAANPDRRVIVTTHAYMNPLGDRMPDTSTQNFGDSIWNDFASQHENIVMLLCGHEPVYEAVVRQDLGVHGNTVTQILVDPQQMGVSTAPILMLYFSEDGREVSAEFIAAGFTIRDSAPDDLLYRANSQFELTLITDEVSSTEISIPADQQAIYESDLAYTGEASMIKLGDFELLNLSNGGISILGAIANGSYGFGNYHIKATVNPTQKLITVEITLPEGGTVRRGLPMSATERSFTVKAYGAIGSVSGAKVAYADVAPNEYTVITKEPVYEGFSANVYNLITSFTDARYDRAFAWTALESFIGEGEMAVMYRPVGETEWITVDAVRQDETISDAEDYFKADIWDLAPDTSYEYRIGKKGSSDYENDWSKTYVFKTEPVNIEDFSFIAFGDNQGHSWDGSSKYNKGYMYAQVAMTQALKEIDPAFILNTGDMVETNAINEWNWYFKALGVDTGATIPHFATIGGGKHDGHDLFDMHFNHPNNGGQDAYTNIDSITGVSFLGEAIKNYLMETVYSFDHGDVHFVVVDSGAAGHAHSRILMQAQRAWLEADLEANKDAKWTILMTHQPAYHQIGANYDREFLADIVEAYGVDLVLSGHTHLVSRSYPIKNGEIVTKVGTDTIEKGLGTIYTTIGSTAVNHDTLAKPNNEKLMTIVANDNLMPTYTVVNVTGNKLTVTIRQVDGLVLDTFSIVSGEPDCGGDHSYESVVTEPTCNESGSVTYTCTVCGDKYVEKLPAVGHVYDNEFDADCNNCGEVREVEVPVYTVAEGVCGVNTTWVLTSDGVLTISGNGDTEDYLVSITTEQPYRAYADKITKVVIEEGVTSIGRGAFYGFTAITEVVLPESLIAIHEYAFFGCTGITSISIPENTFYIGMYAFRKSGLTEMTFANAEGWKFADDTALDVTNVKAFTTEFTYKQTCMRPVYEDGEIIANGVFGNKDQFSWTLSSTGVLTVSGKGNMPKFNVNTTPWYGYRGAIRAVVIEEGITSVGRCSFHTCRAITNITLPESLETIAEYAFYNCQFLTEATIPANVTRIEIYAFRKCYQLKDVTFAINYGWSANGEKISATEINSNAADMLTLVNYTKIWTRDVNAEEEVLDPNYVTGGACNTTVKWALTYIDDSKTSMKLTISGTGAMPKFETAGTPWYGYLDNIVEVEVCEGITEIGRCAFYGLKFVKVATIADTVTSINDYVFSGCFSLKSIEIPESVTFIADTAFTKTGLSEIPTV